VPRAGDQLLEKHHTRPEGPFGLVAGALVGVDQIVWAESLGYGSVWLSEHHFVEDGYTPSPLVLAAAVAVRTDRVRIGTSLVVLPLHDPVRVAEDAATVSILSGGRFELGVAQGYRLEEFEAFGRRPNHRPSLLEEGIEILRRSWSGDPLRFEAGASRIRQCA